MPARGTDPRWVPIRRGKMLCSPACGRGCTVAEHAAAVHVLAKTMGTGWTTRIWENLGWHYNVVSPCGRIKVTPNIDWKTRRVRDYTAFLGARGDRSCSGRWAEHGRTPRAAIRRVVRVAKNELADIGAVLEGL